MEDPRERRKNVRVPFRAAVTIRPLAEDSKPIRSYQTRDLSLKGLYFLSERTLPCGTRCEVELRLSGPDVLICAFGEVVRSDENGIGISFSEMDIDSFSHLRSLLYYNTGDTDRIDHEILADDEQRSIGRKR
jgi:c-di-GMP-binding flagellar brake protein YcgR